MSKKILTSANASTATSNPTIFSNRDDHLILANQALIAESINPVYGLNDHSTESIKPVQPSLLNVILAEFSVARGLIPEALHIYKQESLKNNATSVFERALELSLYYEPLEESLKFARTWQLKNPDHLPAQFYVVHLALKAHDYQLAGEVLNQILQYDSQADLSEILIGIAPTSISDQQHLLTTLESLPKYDNPSILVMQASLLSQLGKPEAALTSVNKALVSQPDNVAYILLKADILKSLLPNQAVLNYISQQRVRLQANKSLYLYEIRYLLELNQTQNAWEILLEAHSIFKDDQITLLAALVSIDNEAYSKADELLKSLLSSSLYADQAYYYLGISAERQQDYGNAERYYAKVMQESLVLNARQKLVSLLLMQDRPERALQVLREFGSQFAVYAPECAIMQADILRQQNKLDEAQQVLAETNKLFPDDTKLLYARVQLLDSHKKADLKRRLIDHLLLLDPENLSYQLALAILLFENDNDKDNDQALIIAQSILNIPFNDPNYKAEYYLTALNIVAADALSKQDYQQVVDYLETVYQVSPTLDSGILLLRAYQGLGLDNKVTELFNDIQNRFAVGKQDINNRLQSY